MTNIEAFIGWPPLYTRQVNEASRNKQLSIWTQIILNYMRDNSKHTASKHKYIFDANLAITQMPFTNDKISKSLSMEFLLEIMTYMVHKQQQPLQQQSDTSAMKVGCLAEWLDDLTERLIGKQQPSNTTATKDKTKATILSNTKDTSSIHSDKPKTRCIVWWKRPEELLMPLLRWLEDCGERGNIFTVYDFVQGSSDNDENGDGDDVSGSDYAHLGYAGMEAEVFLAMLGHLKANSAAYGVKVELYPGGEVGNYLEWGIQFL